MFTTHQDHAVPARTTLLVATAIVLGLVSSTLFGATPDGEQAAQPGLLPAGAVAAAVPMQDAGEESFAADAWKAIEQHNARHWGDAIAIWRRASVPPESQIWRHLSLGVAQLNLGNFELADEQFTMARKLNRENPAVHYFVGLLRVRQAADACEHEDAVPLTGTRLVDYVPAEPPASLALGQARRRFELEAINELETAVTYAARLDLAAPLANVQWVVPIPYPIAEPVAAPTVGELLGSLGADNLAGKSHGLLSSLYLSHGRPDQAEYHTDEASSLGIDVPYAYRTTGKLYEERGQNADAFRVYLKAMQQGDGIVAPGSKALRNLGSALRGLN